MSKKRRHRLNAKEKCEKVLKELIVEGETGQFTKQSLDAAIINALNVIDPRTISNIGNALVTLGYLTQTAPKIYKLNLEKIAAIPALKQLTIEESQHGC